MIHNSMSFNNLEGTVSGVGLAPLRERVPVYRRWLRERIAVAVEREQIGPGGLSKRVLSRRCEEPRVEQAQRGAGR